MDFICMVLAYLAQKDRQREREERKGKHLKPNLYVNMLNRSVFENDGVSFV